MLAIGSAIDDVRAQFITGACCLPNGSCTVTLEISCAVQNGIFRGNATTCADVICTGACCIPNGSCTSVSSQSCASAAGEFRGFGSLCANQVCAGACCLPDKSCTETIPGNCTSLDGLFQGLGTLCGDECPVPMPTAFTYQGQLKRGGLVLNGPIDARFSLWLSPTGQELSDQIGGTLLHNGIEVANGLFTVDLDFGQNAFNGNERWLQIEVHGPDDPPGTFTTLTPRQPLTPTPYALETRGIVVTDNGNVGIGTKTPTSKLEIAAQDGLAITGFQPFLTLRDTGGGGAVTIGNSGGNVGIGTTAPNAGLHVKKEAIPPGGTLALEGTTHTYMTFFPDGVANGRKGYLGFASGATYDISLANEIPGGNINLVPGPLGAVTIGPYYAPAGEENLRIVRGVFSGSGEILAGTGFSVVRTNTGRYTVTFNSAFLELPTVTCSGEWPYGWHILITVSTHDVALIVHGADSVYMDETVHFIAIGPR